MRIISGTQRGRKLHTFTGNRIRPTSDRMREAIFNILSTGVRDAVVLDLYSGTGALGIEALSRGARSAVFVDNGAPSIDLLKKNINACSLLKKTRVLRWDISANLNCLNPLRPRFTLVFMDPPYACNMVRPTLIHLQNSGSLDPAARIVIEHGSGDNLPLDLDAFQVEDQRKYGKNLVSFFKFML